MPSKVLPLSDLLKIVFELKAHQKKIVWTNGCFDILHVGHVQYLEQAKTFGDVLIVGLNSDSSVKILKGTDRPIFNERDRATVLSAIVFIDYIVMFNESSPLEILKLIQPDFYVKGGDYTIDSLDQRERKLIESYHGTIKLLPMVKGISTSCIIEKI